MWHRVGSLLKRAGELRDGFLVTAAVFYFFGYVVWAINAYRNNLGLLPALEFQYFVAGASPVFIVLVLYCIVIAFKRFNKGVEVWIGAAPTGWKLILSWIMSILAFIAVVSLFVLAELRKDAVQKSYYYKTWLFVLIVLVIIVCRPFSKKLEETLPADQATNHDPAPGTSRVKWLFAHLFVIWCFYLRLVYFMYVPMVFIVLASLAGVYSVNVYPKIPQEFGGARPRYACLDLVKAQISIETIEGILPADANKSNAVVVRSRRVEVLFSGGDVILVRSQGRVYQIAKSIIQAMSVCD